MPTPSKVDSRRRLVASPPPPRRLASPGLEAASLAESAVQRLEALCRAAEFGPHTENVTTTFRALLRDGSVEHVPPGWSSEISDDNTPIELSVALGRGGVEVRALFEPQGERATVAAFRSAALAFNRRLERDYGANLGRFRQVKELFVPPDMQGPFAVWSSAVFSSRGEVSFKAYLNVQARGVDHSEALVAEGLRRLGLERAWSRLRTSALRRGSHLDELKYFALDLSDGPEARVKVYVRHHDASARELELAVGAAPNARPAETLDFVRAMRGGDERLSARAAFTCASFTRHDLDAPSAITVYVPVCAYARDDAVVTQRLSAYLKARQLEPSLYQAVIDGFANRPLDAGVGMQSWAAFQRRRGEARLTVYLATEANRVHAPGLVPAPTGDRSSARLPAGATPDESDDRAG